MRRTTRTLTVMLALTTACDLPDPGSESDDSTDTEATATGTTGGSETADTTGAEDEDSTADSSSDSLDTGDDGAI